MYEELYARITERVKTQNKAALYTRDDLIHDVFLDAVTLIKGGEENVDIDMLIYRRSYIGYRSRSVELNEIQKTPRSDLIDLLTKLITERIKNDSVYTGL